MTSIPALDLQATVLSPISVTWSSPSLNNTCQMYCPGYRWESFLWISTLTICRPSCQKTQIYSPLISSNTLIFREMEAFVFWGKQEVLLLIFGIEKVSLEFSRDLNKFPVLFHLRGSGSFLSVGRTESRTSHLDFYPNYIDAYIIAFQQWPTENTSP